MRFKTLFTGVLLACLLTGSCSAIQPRERTIENDKYGIVMLFVAHDGSAMQLLVRKLTLLKGENIFKIYLTNGQLLYCPANNIAVLHVIQRQYYKSIQPRIKPPTKPVPPQSSAPVPMPQFKRKEEWKRKGGI